MKPALTLLTARLLAPLAAIYAAQVRWPRFKPPSACSCSASPAMIRWIPIVCAATTMWADSPDPSPPVEVNLVETKPIFDDFASGTLDPRTWLIARTQWGGENVNGGVVPENIHVQNDKLIIIGHGDHYTGPVRGVERTETGSVSPIAHGRRTGACLVTRDCYASGRYEVRMKVPQNLGVCTALWTFHYLEVDPQHEEYITHKGQGDVYISNHEIDIELPGRPDAKPVGIGYDWALCNT